MIESKEEKTIVCPLLTAAYAEQEECMDKCAWITNVNGISYCSIPIIAKSLYKMQLQEFIDNFLRGL